MAQAAPADVRWGRLGQPYCNSRKSVAQGCEPWARKETVSISIIVNDEQEFQENLLLKTKKQWRKDARRKVVDGAKPVDHFDLKYTVTEKSEEIATDGKPTETKRAVAKLRQIPLYSIEQTQPYKRLSTVLLRDMYCRYFVDDAERQTYLWWGKDGHWLTCRGYLDDEKIRLHLKGSEIYGVLGGEYTCFSAIDADFHGGDYHVFKDQVALVLKNLHGRDRWHYSISPRGVHILKTHEKTLLSQARADLRKLLTEIDAQDPELHQRAVAAAMKPIEQWEIYPDPKQSFRLPLACGRVTLLERPYEKVDLRTYVGWQIEPTYCTVEEAMAAIFSIIQPLHDAAPPKEQKEKAKPQVSPPKAPESVFGKLRGRYAQVLVDFWMGRNNPPDSLNCAIVLTARMLPYYFDEPDEAIDFVEGLVDGLPDVGFSDRLTGKGRKEVSRIVRRSVDAVYNGNGHQRDPDLSSSKLAKVFAAWNRKGFSLVDRATWGVCSRAVALEGGDFKWAADDIHALTYFATILRADLETTAQATSQLLRALVNHPTGEMTIKYVKNLLAGCGIKCGHHGKANEYLDALRQAGWIEQVGSYIVGFRGRHWQVGEQIRQKVANHSTTDITNPPRIYICIPLLTTKPLLRRKETSTWTFSRRIWRRQWAD